MRCEEDVNMKKAALETLLNYSNLEMSFDPNSTRANDEKSLIFGNNSFVSFIRGMEYSNQSTPINSQNKGVQSLENPITDSEFFDSETGKQMILNDQISHERLFMQGTSCTGCSAWTLCSQKNLSSVLSGLKSNKSKLKQKTLSVGEFIGLFSETLSFSENQEKNNLFANCLTSTPREKRKSKSMSSLLDMENKESLHTSLSCYDFKRDDLLYVATPVIVKSLKFSTPKWAENNSHSDNFNYFIGSTSRKNIQRLQREEKKLRGTDETFSFNTFEMNKTCFRQTNSNSVATGSDTVTREMRSGTLGVTTDSMDRSCYAQWFVEPELVIINPNKGNRVRLVNKSNKNLKFKTTFDSRMLNVCPLSGTVLQMDKIGLRICISQYAKKRNENFENDVKVIIGKNEKSIQVKFTKEDKSKCLKDRSYILF